jgi:hypothetical protein
MYRVALPPCIKPFASNAPPVYSTTLFSLPCVVKPVEVDDSLAPTVNFILHIPTDSLLPAT